MSSSSPAAFVAAGWARAIASCRPTARTGRRGPGTCAVHRLHGGVGEEGNLVDCRHLGGGGSYGFVASPMFCATVARLERRPIEFARDSVVLSFGCGLSSHWITRAASPFLAAPKRRPFGLGPIFDAGPPTYSPAAGEHRCIFNVVRCVRPAEDQRWDLGPSGSGALAPPCRRQRRR